MRVPDAGSFADHAAGRTGASGADQGVRPTHSHARLGVALFVASDAFTFAALIAAFLYLRPAADFARPLPMALAMTAVLGASAWTMARGRLGLTIALGLAFAGMHGWELWQIAAVNAGSVFAACFFAITGFHLLHVLAGVVWFAGLMVKPSAGALAAARVYWWFVDAVWVVILCALYLS